MVDSDHNKCFPILACPCCSWGVSANMNSADPLDDGTCTIFLTVASVFRADGWLKECKQYKIILNCHDHFNQIVC